jgi:hypothetical protein
MSHLRRPPEVSEPKTGARANRHVVDSIGDLPRGEVTFFTIGSRSIGIVRTADDRLYALRSVCPQHGAPPYAGTVCARLLDSPPRVGSTRKLKAWSGALGTATNAAWKRAERFFQPRRSASGPIGASRRHGYWRLDLKFSEHRRVG